MKLSTILNKISKDTHLTFNITNQIILKTSYRRILKSALFTAVLLATVLINTNAFFKPDVPYGILLYILSVVGCLLTGMLCVFEYAVPKKLEKTLTVLSILLIPIGTMTMVECMNGVFVGNWEPAFWVLNCIFYALLYLPFYALFGSRKIPFLVLNPIVYLLSIINHYVFTFRGTPFLPMDLLYTETAANVVGKYELSLDFQVIISTVLLALLQAIAWKIKTPNKKLLKKVYYRTLAAVISLSILVSYFTSDTIANLGFSPDFFHQGRGYKRYGVTLSFFMNTKYLKVTEPDSYSVDNVKTAVYEVLGNDFDKNKNLSACSPNVICIMNESLSDLSVLGKINTNKDYMPFLRNLTDNTVKGNLYVPVIGAGTSNTEYEFLTGATTAFLPVGSNAYTLYVNHGLYGLTKTIEKQGYSSAAFHPYFQKNWNRINAYNYLGFNNYYGIESFLSNETTQLMYVGAKCEELTSKITKQYPNESVITRTFVNDDFNYKKIIEMYENKDIDKPFYLFNVTMQNHGGYETTHSNFKEEIYLVDEEGNKNTTYPQTNQYLSLIYESDKAFKNLVDYFAKQDEPTVICMFGDHQPSIENEFLEDTLGVDSVYNLSTKQTQSRYVTPFYIWANYEIDEKTIDKLSVNYLSSYLMNIIGMEMPVFNQYLLKLSETLPVINTVGYIDANNNYYTYDEETQYNELINGYQNICYNYLFDEKECCDWLFTVKE